MSKITELSGQCLCGSIEITAQQVTPHVDACHCNMCRTWGGGPAITIEAESAGFKNEAELTIFNSSDWAERAFCAKCGTHMFYRLKDQSKYYLPAGLFPKLEGKADMQLQIFVDQKPSYYEFANETKMMTGEEVFAMFAEK